MALMEGSTVDANLGMFVQGDIASYHFASNLDAPETDVIFIDEVDSEVNSLGIKGLGELGIVGSAAAVANAIYHATGIRIRDLPVTVDKLIIAANG